jgi:hypothetical protein
MARVAQLGEAEPVSSARTAAGTRKYLYAVIAASPERNFGAAGLNEAPVYFIGKGRVAAAVSDIANGEIQPARRHLAAHQQVLRCLMQETTPLPMSFGLVADSARAVQKILAENEEAFLSQLERVAGKVEMGLRATWDVPNIFEYFINTHPELKATRDRFLGGYRPPTQEEKIELGRFFDRLLQEDRETYTEQVESALGPRCFEVKRNRCRSEREVMNLACLVGIRSRAEFEAAVLEAARLFDNNFAFDYNGPWAPHNFVEMDLAL